MSPRIDESKIPESEKTPLVLVLLEELACQSVTIQQQAELIQQLKDEISRLKGEKPKPDIRPSKLEKNGKKKKKRSSDKRPGSLKRSKTAELIINEEISVPPEFIPPGSTFKGCQPYTVQGIRVFPYNVCYLLERWESPDGKSIMGKLPEHVQGHFDPSLKRYILYQYFQCHVTQPLLLEELREIGVDISAGQLNRILIEEGAFQNCR
jgi:hypothetical protein